MEDFLDILKYTLPSGIVFATSFFLIRAFLENNTRKRLLELKMNNQNVITPLRLQAYERIILLLERISPSSLIMRLARPDMSAAQFQQTLINSIREEFEHNLSQQIYISSTAWEMTKNAKEDIIKMINIAASRLNEQATATDLGALIFEMSMQKDKLLVNTAIEYIKKEFRQLY